MADPYCRAADGRLRSGPPDRAAADRADGRIPAGPASGLAASRCRSGGWRAAGGHIPGVVRQLQLLPPPSQPRAAPPAGRARVVSPPRSQSTGKGLGPLNAADGLAALKAYTGSDQGVGKTLGRHFGEQIVEPWAHLVRGYQRFIHLPGPVFGLILLIGFIGILIPRRRLAASGLLITSAVVTVLLPIVEHEYNYRYVIAAL